MVGIGILIISPTAAHNGNHLDSLLGIDEGVVDEVSIDVNHFVKLEAI